MRRGAVVVVLLLSVMSACGDSGAESEGATVTTLTPVVPVAGTYRGDVDSQKGVTSRVSIEVAEGGDMIIGLTLAYDLTDFACKGRTHNSDLTYLVPLNPQIPIIDGTFVDNGSPQWEGVFVSESRLEGTIGGELMVGTPPVMCEIEPWTFSAELDTESGAASASPERVGGTRYVGVFESGPGYGPGEITLVLDGTGDAFSQIVYDPKLDEFACPNGRTVSGGGWAVGGTLPIVGDSFDLSIGVAGVFVSATEVRGTYDMEYDYGCDQVLTWTATSQGTASSTTTQALAVETTLPPATTLPPETSLPPETTVAVDRLEEDRILITQFWVDYTEAWSGGLGDGLDWIATHSHPDLGFERDDLACAYAGVATDYREEASVDPWSVRSDDGWVLAGSLDSPSPVDGTVPRGRIYVAAMEFVFASPGSDPVVVNADIHVAVLPDESGEDRVWMFFVPGC